MTNEEADRMYQQLLQSLESIRLHWVAEQVREEVSLGKLELKRVRVFETDAAELAIGISTVPSRPQRAFPKELGTSGPTPEAVFSFQDDRNPNVHYMSDVAGRQRLNGVVEKIRGLLAELRRELYAH
jgi:hypothetical protein